MPAPSPQAVPVPGAAAEHAGRSPLLDAPLVRSMLGEQAGVEEQLADPRLHDDPTAARDLGRRYAELSAVAEDVAALQAAEDDLGAARELGADDPGFAEEIPALEQRRDDAEAALRRRLRPRDPLDGKDVILEVKAGEGGEESALFAGDLLRMYLRFAERQGWKAEVLDATETERGGYKDISVSIKGRGSGDGPWASLKWEGGVHRVQRVPATESQGRVHTSAAGVLVLPEAADVEVSLDAADLRVDTFRSSGPGGQSVNTTDSAIRITHLPTGTVVSCQNEKSQLQNKESALRILRARLLARAREEQAAEASAQRASQVRTVDRSERVRTYNFPQRRLTDHRVGFTAYNLEAVLDGDVTAVVDAVADGLAGDLVAPDGDGPAR